MNYQPTTVPSAKLPHHSSVSSDFSKGGFVAACLPHFGTINDVEEETDLLDAFVGLPELFTVEPVISRADTIIYEHDEVFDMVDVGALLCVDEDVAVPSGHCQKEEDDWMILLPLD